MRYGRTLTTAALVAALAATAYSGWWEPASGTAATARPSPLAMATSPAAGARIAPTTTAGTPDGLRDLLTGIEQRTQALDAREANVEARTAMLRSLEESVSDALTHLEAGGCGAGATGGRLHGGVTKIYENMRAEQAAAILDRLDDDTLRVVFAGMEPRRIGAIMAEMSRERAVAFTRTLAADTPTAPTTVAHR